MTRSKAETAALINRNGIMPDNFTQIPNMAFKDLKPNAFKLLAVYLDISKSGDVYAKNSTIAKALGTSVNTMKNARKELVDKGYILLAPGKDGKETVTASITIQIAWMWEENHKRQSKTQPVQTVSKSDTPLSNSDTMLSKIDSPSNQDLNIKTDISKEKESAPMAQPLPITKQPISKTERDAWYDAIADVWGYEKGRNVNMQDFLRGTYKGKETDEYFKYQLPTDSGLTPDKLRAWGKSYCDNNHGARMLEKLEKVQSAILAYLKSNGTPKPKNTLAIVGERGYVTDSASDGVIRFEKPAKDSA